MDSIVAVILLILVGNTLVFAPLTAWLADERGRDPLPWFALGAIVGLAALITVGLGPRKVGATFKAFIECQEPIAIEAMTCPFCGTDLIEAEAAERRSPASSRPPEI